VRVCVPGRATITGVPPAPPPPPPSAPAGEATASRVLVTGGAGYIGRALVPALVRAGCDVVVLDRRPGPGRWVTGDVRTPPPDLADADVVVHLAGLAGGGPEPEAVLHDVNAGGTAALVGHARRRGVRRVVLASSIAVLGPTELPLDERAPRRPTTPYGRSKAAAELAGLAAAEGGPDVCVVRPGYVFGPGHAGNFGRLVEALRRGRFVLPGRGDTLKAGIALPDLVDLLVHLSLAPAVPPLLHAVAPDTPTLEVVCRTLARAVGRGGDVRVAPEPLVRAALSAADRVGPAIPGATGLAERVRKLRESSNVVSRELGGRVPGPQLDWSTALALAAGVSPRAAGAT
jgi:nucleoside-diphosphate-sugar epimerase